MNVRQPVGLVRARGRATVPSLVALGALLALTTSAQAQPTDAPRHAETAAAEAFQKDVTTFNASLGGSLNTGNTEAMLVNLGTAFALVRGHHGLGLSMDFAYGRANMPSDNVDALIDTARNLRSRGRYDLFLTELDALFVSGVYRWDTFAGLDARLSGQVGYLRNLVKQDEVRLWGELGYDLTYDNFDPDPLRDRVPDGIPPSAGALVDRAGLKGVASHGARVSPAHANFIVNDGSASAADIRELIERCRTAVKDKFGVML